MPLLGRAAGFASQEVGRRTGTERRSVWPVGGDHWAHSSPSTLSYTHARHEYRLLVHTTQQVRIMFFNAVCLPSAVTVEVVRH